MSYTTTVMIPRKQPIVTRVFSETGQGKKNITIPTAQNVQEALANAKNFIYTIIKSSQAIINIEVTDENEDEFQITVRVMD